MKRMVRDKLYSNDGINTNTNTDTDIDIVTTIVSDNDSDSETVEMELSVTEDYPIDRTDSADLMNEDSLNVVETTELNENDYKNWKKNKNTTNNSTNSNNSNKNKIRPIKSNECVKPILKMASSPNINDKLNDNNSEILKNNLESSKFKVIPYREFPSSTATPCTVSNSNTNSKSKSKTNSKQCLNQYPSRCPSPFANIDMIKIDSSVNSNKSDFPNMKSNSKLDGKSDVINGKEIDRNQINCYDKYHVSSFKKVRNIVKII